MAVVFDYVDVDSDGWTDVTPSIAGTTVSCVNASNVRGAVLYKTGTTLPASSDLVGWPLASGDGFIKKTITDLTHDGTHTNLYVRAINGTGRVLVEFET